MNTDCWITVPTYWEVGGDETKQTAMFDHPTPLDSDGTLARMLESFRCLKHKVPILIIVGTNTYDEKYKAHDKVMSILEPFSKEMDIFLISDKNLPEINKHILVTLFELTSYGNIRNIQYAIPYLLGAQYIIGIDDDEIIVDSDFVEKALEYLGKPINGKIVGGMAGPYFDSKGEYRLPNAKLLKNEKNIFLKKNYYMNMALEKVMETADVKFSNVSFGGNTAITKATIEKACHDPYIPRGEDYDFVMNAMVEGVTFLYHPQMGITHLPPDSTGSQAGDNSNKLMLDIKRFIYVKEKYNYCLKTYPDQCFAISEVSPYPGVYLDEKLDLKSSGVEALTLLYPDQYDRNRALEIIDLAVIAAKQKAVEYYEYLSLWKKTLPTLSDNKDLQKTLLALWIK